MRYVLREKTREKISQPFKGWEGDPSEDWAPDTGIGAFTTEVRHALLGGLDYLPSVEGNARWAVDEKGSFLMGWAHVQAGANGAVKWVFVPSKRSLEHDVKFGYLLADPFILPPPV